MLPGMTPNRITKHIDEVRDKLAALDPEKWATIDDTLAIDFDEHFTFQETQARAHADGTLTTDEAQIVYIALGEIRNDGNGGWADGTDTATKFSITQLMQELLKSRVAA